MWSSVAVHAAICGLLALVAIPQFEAPPELLVAAVPEEAQPLAAADLEPIDAEELTPADATDEPTDPSAAELTDSGAGTLGDPAPEVALANFVADEFAPDGGPLGGGLADATRPFAGGAGEGAGSGGLGDSGGGRGEFGMGLGAKPTAKFFGAKIEGKRIVFVLDNSGSMQGGRLETVIAELRRSVDSLAADQQFYVFFYSDQVYPLFYPQTVDRYVAPTEETKKRLAAWLDTVELCLGDSVIDAMNAAVDIEPSTVLLLSDGRIASKKNMARLLAGGGGFPIHTIAVGLGKAPVGRQNLESIAKTHHGEFRDAPVSAEMRELAEAHPRPYHNDAPGAVWGRSVRAGGWGQKK